jgi:hypothetical protein
LTSKPPVVGRIVTATVALVCVLIVYDGWAALEPFDVVVIVGPVVAICTTHVFSGSLVQLVVLGRRPTTKEWLVTARFELRFLLLAVPPLAVLLVLHGRWPRNSQRRAPDRRRPGAAGRARPSADSTSVAPRRRDRSRDRGPPGAGKPSAAWRRTPARVPHQRRR